MVIASPRARHRGLAGEVSGVPVLARRQARRLGRALFDLHGRLRREVIGKSAQMLAAIADISVPPETRVLVVPVPRAEVAGPFGAEKLAPVLSFFDVDVDVDADADADAIALCKDLLTHGGRGHTAVVHSTARARQVAMATPYPRAGSS